MSRTEDPSPRIEYLRRTGMSDSIIVNRLVLEGWGEAELVPTLAPAGSVLPAVEMPAHAEHGSDLWRWHISISTAVLGAAALGALAFAAYVMYKPPVVYSISIPSSAASTTGPILTYGALPALSDPDYYRNVKRNLVEQKASFIDANLSSMKLVVYVGGVLQIEVPVLAKGKVGSWWETPAGVYQIESKERNHFSTFGEVNQPWSLDFQGNFFIHGWPTYADGTAVSSSYSGGCIRLSTDDAKKVYDLTVVGMPVIVYNVEAQGDSFTYQLKAPPVSAAGYLVADVKNGTVLSSKGASVAAPIASISKLVSALIVTEYINLDKSVTVPKEGLVYTSIPRLKAGTEVRAYDLLFLLLQESSNEAAETFASVRGRSQFVTYMNEKAKAINLSHTVFSDPSGAKGDYSTPEDLFTLLRHIYENRRFIFGITSGDIANSAYGPPAFKNVRNFNIIKNAPAKLIGGKVGQTNEAAETYAGAFTVKVGAQDRTIAVIVLGSRDAEGDVRKLLSFVHDLYAPADATR